MKTYIYRLRFETPVRFGTADAGGQLSETAMTESSDFLFAALMHELAQNGDEESLTRWRAAMEAGEFLLSDLFPYAETEKELHLYLPKPVRAPENKRPTKSFQDQQAERTKAKKLKRMRFLRASTYKNYAAFLRGDISKQSVDSFGAKFLTVRVNQREEESLPYTTAAFVFHAHAGLYFLASMKDKTLEPSLRSTLQSLGLSGIGGKRSSGWGKFSLVDENHILKKRREKDALAIMEVLADDNAPWKMTLSSVLPCREDISALAEGQYTLRKRGGFLTPESGTTTQKKNRVYMLASGSCLRQRIKGRVVSLGNVHGHDILRAGLGFYVGLKI